MMAVQAWLEMVPFPVVITGEDGMIGEGNTLFCELEFCRGKETLTGLCLAELFTGWEECDESQVWATSCERMYLLMRGVMAAPDGAAAFAWVVTDGKHVHQTRQREKELERELDAIMDSSEDIIYITSPDGMTLRASRAIKRFTGHPKEAFVGKNVNDLVKQGLLTETLTSRVVNLGKPIRTVPPSLPNNQSALKTAIPVFNEAGQIEKVVTYVRDLTKQNRLFQELVRALEENKEYKKELAELKTKGRQDPGIVVESKKMVEIYNTAERIADVDATVLILGETGVGKDVLARSIYQASRRREKGEFVKINCGAIPHDLLESELFGYEPGSFTGASKAGKRGIFEQADKGVLFLDEVGELPITLQVKLLRVLQEKQIQRIGATKSRQVDVRLIAATNRDLKQMVRQGTFREDLYYRLNVIPIIIPALRERREDILPLVRFFLAKLNEKYKLSKEFNYCLLEFFYRYHWPGNVRELANLVERLILTVPFKAISFKDLPIEYQEQDTGARPHPRLMSLKEAAEVAEREMLALAVQKFNSTYKLAEELGTSQATIVRKLKKYQLSTSHFLDQANHS